MNDVVTVSVPGDKSVGIRALLLALLADGSSNIRGLADSRITSATIDALRTLGAVVDVTTHPTCGLVAGGVDVAITPPHRLRQGTTIDCGGSATLARLLLGLLSGANIEANVVGSEMLSRRPMTRVATPLQALFGEPVIATTAGHLPARIVHGSRVAVGDDVVRPGDSAQVRSAVMLAALAAKRPVTLWSTRPGRRHTEQLLRWLGLSVVDDDADPQDREARPRRTTIAGGQHVPAINLDVPGDPSQAAFLDALAVLSRGRSIDVVGVLDDIERTGMSRVLRRMQRDGGLRGVTVDAHDVPDLIDEVPILAAVCAGASSSSTLHGLDELRVKESDRLARIVDLLTAFGVRTVVDGDSLTIEPGPWTAPTSPICTDHDHRVGMTALVMARVLGVDVELDDPDCVKESWAGFVGDNGQLAAAALAVGLPARKTLGS
jgi:3-phosphoshikimate 1-carboxyvinyltransferase